MRTRRILLLACSIIVGATTAAGAQEAGTVGITMGYPAAIGLLWHLSDRIALRPEFSFTLTDSSSESLVNDESHFLSLGTGVSALFYWPATDNLRTYAAPRFSYARTHGDSSTTESTTDVYTIAGMFGAQYSLGRRFAAFGEVGLGSRTGVGVVLYF